MKIVSGAELDAAYNKDLRDRFAMAALQGLLACPNTACKHIDVNKYWSEKAFKYADAMMKARGL